MAESVRASDNQPIAVDFIEGAAYQRAKLTVGADGTANDVSLGEPLPASLLPIATQGLSIGKKIAEASTNATSLKAEGGNVYGWAIYNKSSELRVVKLYNKASAPTVGTDVPIITLPIPKESLLSFSSPHGLGFPAGIAFAFTKNLANADATAVAAEDLLLNIFYK